MAETDTVMSSSLRPRARPDNVKPSPPFDPTKDDDDSPQEAEAISIPVTDDSGDNIGNVLNNTVSFDEGFFNRYQASEDISKKTRDSFKQVMDVKDLLNVSDNIGFDNVAGNDVLTVGLGGGFRAFLGGRSIDRPVAGVGFKFAEGGAVDNQMEEILTEKKDPVSGNTAPIGSTPAEVRDDIPIMASPNEFMIDAATRRYYGTPFFENLQAAAKQGFNRIKAGEESFFRDDELEVEQEAQKLQGGGEVKEIPDREIPKPVGGGFGGYGGTGPIFTGFEFKTYVHPTKPEIQITFFNGRPLNPIPEGYTLKAGTPVEQQEQKRDLEDDDDDPNFTEPPKSWRNTNPSDWSMSDFSKYVSDSNKKKSEKVGKLTLVERAILHLIGGSIVPGAGFGLTKIANNATLKQTNQINDEINSMLKSGKDKDGKDLTDDTNNLLFRAQYFANLSNSNLDPQGQSKGTPIFEQPSYQKDDDDDPDTPPVLDTDKLLPSDDILKEVFGKKDVEPQPDSVENEKEEDDFTPVTGPQ